MGNLIIKNIKYYCCVSESTFNDNESLMETPRSVLEEPFKISEKVLDNLGSFKTVVNGNNHNN